MTFFEISVLRIDFAMQIAYNICGIRFLPWKTDGERNETDVAGHNTNCDLRETDSLKTR